MQPQQSQTVSTLQHEIKNIFSTITGEWDLSQQVRHDNIQTVERISQLLKCHLQDTVCESLKRAMWRDASSSILDERDLLHVICSKYGVMNLERDDKYKYKVGQAFVKMMVYKKAEDKGENLKEYKNQENRDRGESSNSDTEEIQKYVMEDKQGTDGQRNQSPDQE